MMIKKIVVVMGSHRSNANTGYWTQEFSRLLKERKLEAILLDVNKLKINHCISCEFCKNNWGQCVHQDDMRKVYENLQDADVVVFATPVYFNGITSKLKTIVDRCQMIFLCDFEHKRPFVSSTNILSKKGYIVSVGGALSYTNQFIGSEISLKLIFNNLRVPLSEHIKYSSTDTFALKDRDVVALDIQRVVDEIFKEVVNSEE